MLPEGWEIIEHTVDTQKRFSDYTCFKKIEMGLRRHLRRDHDGAIAILQRPLEAR